MRATESVSNFVRARIAAATALAVCSFGCRQMETFKAGSDAISVQRPPNPPADSEKATGKATSLPAPTHQELAEKGESSQRTTRPGLVVEVCRIPWNDTNEIHSIPTEDTSDVVAPIDCNITAALGTIETCCCEEPEPLPPNFGDATKGIAGLAPDSPQSTDRAPLSSAETEDRQPKSRLGEILSTTRDNVFQDYGNYYSRRTLVEFVVILAPAAVFANSDLDANFGNWYQQHIRSNSTNRASSFFRPLGNGFYTIPAYVSAKFLGEYFDDRPGMALLGEFGDRTTRALLVGVPPLLAVQYLTGGGRPSDYRDNSYWKPFHGSHGASGHAFMGAVPFLTLAGMTDDPLAKCFFYACSPWTGMTRVNDNVHYLSQVWLGWWMAYLACDAVHKTEKANSPVVITPVCTPEMTGVGFIYQH